MTTNPSLDKFDLTGRVAVVVGAAAGGLGEHAARALHRAGATLALADLPDRADDVSTTAQSMSSTPSMHTVDVADEGSVDQLRDEILIAHGRIDILVVTSGVMLRETITATSADDFRRVMDVNVTGTWLLNRAFAPVMAEAGYGRIINLSTVYAERVGPIPESAYYSSKAAVANLTRSVATEFGGSGVTVNCLAPGVFYPTRMTAPLSQDPERLEWFAQRTMLGRLGHPEVDFAGPIVFLASDAGSYITGQILYVDGGWSAW